MKKLLSSWRMIVLFIFLILSVIAIHPAPQTEGLAIRSVDLNSSAHIAGLESPHPNTQPLARERVLSIDNQAVYSLEDYNALVSSFEPNISIRIKTNEKTYFLKTKPLIESVLTNETKLVTTQENVTVNGTTELVNITKEVPVYVDNVIGVEDLGLALSLAPSSNIRKGLDLTGGSRVVLEPEEKVNDQLMETITSSLRERLNVYGLTDIVIRQANDLAGNQFVIVEIAEFTEKEVRELLGKQGKFEATIGQETVFRGGENDIPYVCQGADCSGIDLEIGCQKQDDGWVCPYYFNIALSPEAAERQAQITDTLTVEGEHLSEKLYMFLDDKEVTALNIGAELKGRAVTQVRIQGYGSGATSQEAKSNAIKEMKRLQTVIITGSLPVKMNIVRMDSISPALGKQFMNNAVFIGLFALMGVSLVIFLRYRTLKIVIPIILSLIFEVCILLGFAAITRWNLDLAALAGIIITLGTGVDHLIIITDEVLNKESSQRLDRRIKSAMFIVMGAFFTTVVGMLPLWFAGAGLLRGFAFITIAGLAFGVLLVRPAYARVIEHLVKE